MDHHSRAYIIGSIACLGILLNQKVRTRVGLTTLCRTAEVEPIENCVEAIEPYSRDVHIRCNDEGARQICHDDRNLQVWVEGVGYYPLLPCDQLSHCSDE